MDNEIEKVHRFYCSVCGRSSMFTEQDVRTSLVPLENLKCTCGAITHHKIEHHDRTWVNRNIREKALA